MDKEKEVVVKMELIIKIIYYLASILSIFLFVISVQHKEKKHILLTQAFATMCYFITYLIVGAYSGCAVELIEQTKDFVFYSYENKNKKIPLILLIVFASLLVLVSIVTFNGLYSLIPLLINLAYFISSYFKNPKHIRVVMLICGFIWAYYNFKVGAYVIIIGNILEIISAFISLIKSKEEK